MWGALEKLQRLREYETLLLAPSDPGLDGSLPLLPHALRTAEACRRAFPQHDWLHLVGLLHGLGKLLASPECAPALRKLALLVPDLCLARHVRWPGPCQSCRSPACSPDPQAGPDAARPMSSWSLPLAQPLPLCLRAANKQAAYLPGCCVPPAAGAWGAMAGTMREPRMSVQQQATSLCAWLDTAAASDDLMCHSKATPGTCLLKILYSIIVYYHRYGSTPQWAVCGETFPVGCAYAATLPYARFFGANPDKRRRCYTSPCGETPSLPGCA